MASKFLKIGQVRLVEPKGKDSFEVMELENENLQEFIKLLREFGKNKIGDKDQKEIEIRCVLENIGYGEKIEIIKSSTPFVGRYKI